MAKKSKKGSIPWHKKVDEDLIKHVAHQFVKQAWFAGFQIRQLNVKWDGKDFNISTHGNPREDEDPETVH